MTTQVIKAIKPLSSIATVDHRSYAN